MFESMLVRKCMLGKMTVGVKVIQKWTWTLLLMDEWRDGHAQDCGNTMPDLSNFSHFPEDKYKNFNLHVLDKDFIALAKKSIQIILLL